MGVGAGAARSAGMRAGPAQSRVEAIIASPRANSQACVLDLPRTSRRSAARASPLPRPALAAVLVAGCSTIDTYLPTLRSLRRLQARHQPGQLPVAGHGGQAQGRADEAAGPPAARHAAPGQRRSATDRWDYVYEFTRQGRVVEHRTFTVYFVDDKLARWEGDEMPASVAELNRQASARTAGEAKWADQRSWFEKLLDFFQQRSRWPSRIAVAGAGGTDGPGADRGDARRSGSDARRGVRRSRAVAAVGRDAGERFGRVDRRRRRRPTPTPRRDAADVLIDFTRPEGTLAHLAACARHGTGAVVGTTGLSDGAEGGARGPRAQRSRSSSRRT